MAAATVVAKTPDRKIFNGIRIEYAFIDKKISGKKVNEEIERYKLITGKKETGKLEEKKNYGKFEITVSFGINAVEFNKLTELNVKQVENAALASGIEPKQIQKLLNSWKNFSSMDIEKRGEVICNFIKDNNEKGLATIRLLAGPRVNTDITLKTSYYENGIKKELKVKDKLTKELNNLSISHIDSMSDINNFRKSVVDYEQFAESLKLKYESVRDNDYKKIEKLKELDNNRKRQLNNLQKLHNELKNDPILKIELQQQYKTDKMILDRMSELKAFEHEIEKKKKLLQTSINASTFTLRTINVLKEQKDIARKFGALKPPAGINSNNSVYKVWQAQTEEQNLFKYADQKLDKTTKNLSKIKEEKTEFSLKAVTRFASTRVNIFELIKSLKKLEDFKLKIKNSSLPDSEKELIYKQIKDKKSELINKIQEIRNSNIDIFVKETKFKKVIKNKVEKISDKIIKITEKLPI